MSELFKITTMISPTKPGPGWVQVTPKDILFFEKQGAKLREIHEKLKEFKAEVEAEDKKTTNANI